jgi:hypothetical protein
MLLNEIAEQLASSDKPEDAKCFLTKACETEKRARVPQGLTNEASPS